MELALEVERDGRVETHTVGTDLSNADDLLWVVALAGRDAVYELAQGSWNPAAARAIIYVNLNRALGADMHGPAFPFGDMVLNWGEYTPYLEADPAMESALDDLSVVTE